MPPRPRRFDRRCARSPTICPTTGGRGWSSSGVTTTAGRPAVTLPTTSCCSSQDIKTDGNIVPPPTMTVEARTFAGAGVAVLTTWPSDSPPVRYTGRIWIRVGPRRAHFERAGRADSEREATASGPALRSAPGATGASRRHQRVRAGKRVLRFVTLSPNSVPATRRKSSSLRQPKRNQRWHLPADSQRDVLHAIQQLGHRSPERPGGESQRGDLSLGRLVVGHQPRPAIGDARGQRVDAGSWSAGDHFGRHRRRAAADPGRAASGGLRIRSPLPVGIIQACSPVFMSMAVMRV